jgi:hypothetical protein
VSTAEQIVKSLDLITAQLERLHDRVDAVEARLHHFDAPEEWLFNAILLDAWTSGGTTLQSLRRTVSELSVGECEFARDFISTRRRSFNDYCERMGVADGTDKTFVQTDLDFWVTQVLPILIARIEQAHYTRANEQPKALAERHL